jgi:hypothetical protein
LVKINLLVNIIQWRCKVSLIEEKVVWERAADIQAEVDRERVAQQAAVAGSAKPGPLRVIVGEWLISIALRLEDGGPARPVYLAGRGRGLGWSR